MAGYEQQQQPDINGVDIGSDAIAAVILDEDGEDNKKTPEKYLEATNTTISSSQLQTAAESLASLYYPLYDHDNDNESKEKKKKKKKNLCRQKKMRLWCISVPRG